MRQFESRSFAIHLVYLVACAALCIAGCASSGTTLGADPEDWANSISVGDHLKVLTKSGNERDLHVTAVNKSGISDNKEFIPYNDIQSIRVLPSSSGGSGNTALVVMLTVVVVAVFASLLKSEVEEGFIQPAQ
jgi:hypothetical protein